jgi:hypothetical protein
MEVALSKALKGSLESAEKTLGRAAEIRTLITTGTERLSVLSAQRGQLEGQHARAAAGLQLREVAAGTVAALQKQLESADAEIKQLSSTLPVLRQRYADLQPGLTGALADISGPLEFYVEKVCSEFAPVYEQARLQFEAACALGRALGVALRTEIPMGPPEVPSSGFDVGPGPARVADVLARIGEAVSEIERSRAGIRRDALRRKPFEFGESVTYEFLRTISVSGQEFKVGQRVIGNLLGRPTLERLYAMQAVKVISQVSTAA